MRRAYHGLHLALTEIETLLLKIGILALVEVVTLLLRVPISTRT